MTLSLRRLVVLVAALVTSLVTRGAHAREERTSTEAIEALVGAYDVPGAFVEVVDEHGALYTSLRGHEDLEATRPVTRATVFELGATAESFLAVGVALLEAEGKLSREDPVTRFLPWFWMTVGGERPPITLGHLLHHTSGIPPVPEPAGTLEGVVRGLVGGSLRGPPGRELAPSNADMLVLALVLETFGSPLDRFLRDRVLSPLGLSSTFVGSRPDDGGAVPPAAVGYERFFGGWRKVNAEPPRHARALYATSTPDDLSRWVQLHLKLLPAPPALEAAIERTHTPDRTVLPDPRGAQQASGWSVLGVAGGIERQTATTATSSSYVGLLREPKVGIVVLTNTASSGVVGLGDALSTLLVDRGWPIEGRGRDAARQVDVLASIFAVLAGLGVVAMTVLAIGQIRDVVLGRRRVVRPTTSRVVASLGALAVVGFAWACLRYAPGLLLDGDGGEARLAHGPASVGLALDCVRAAGATTALYFLVATFTSDEGRVFSWLTVFSVVSGIGNALLIVTMNESFARQDNLANGLLATFGLGLVLYAVGQRIVRHRVIRLTNDLLLRERRRLLRSLETASLQAFERLDRGELLTAIGDDIDTINACLSDVVTGITHTVTLVCCFVYLALLNPLGFTIALGVVGVSVWVHVVVGNFAQKKLEKARDARGRFFGLLQQFFLGFKELKLDRRKHAAFHDDIDGSCEEYKVARVRGDLAFADVFVLGDMLFMSAIGFVAFAYPALFPSMDRDVVRTFVVVFLYMLSPFSWIMSAYPQAVRIRVAWGRIQSVAEGLTPPAGHAGDAPAPVGWPRQVELRVRDVEFAYTDERGKAFRLGPIDCAFLPGQITFLTGGNGSGKSTFAKLITGLYAPDRGEILLNGASVPQMALRDACSAIFSDFHLFQRLYGLDVTDRGEEIGRHLRTLRLDGVVNVEDGAFSTTRLSTGQRRRLALLVSFLEDKPLCLYDEWAAEQDPEFRAFFYETILPDLRARGKCAVVITHDDRYFDRADQVLKLEMGRLVATESAGGAAAPC